MENSKRKICAIIPARKEDDRVQNKNLLPFGDSTLIENKINQLKKIRKLDDIVVSSDDDRILKIAEEQGVNAIRRPEEYSKIDTPFGYYVEYICKMLSCDDILWACCTSPFVDTDTYEHAIELYYENLIEGYDSLITVRKLHRYIIDSNGPVNYRTGLNHKSTNDLNDMFLHTNGIAIASRLNMIDWKYILGKTPYLMEVNKKIGFDISDKFDYQLAIKINEGTINE
ncbi:MAG: acylneuraminate cytidylyltransferase family protein [Lachnospiraceae bacterium]|nr:acylneuraminate cytidylyltransferase family protein [Lachnospiraceae bacterium]